MAQVLVKYEVLPQSVEKIDEVENKLKELNPNSIEKKPIAFGLSAFEISFVLDDEGGKIEELEKKLENLEGVGSVKSLGATLI